MMALIYVTNACIAIHDLCVEVFRLTALDPGHAKPVVRKMNVPVL